MVRLQSTRSLPALVLPRPSLIPLAGLSENFDFIILPENAWKELVNTHGGGPEVRRKCIRQAWSKQNIIEIRPMMIKVCLLAFDGIVRF